MSPHQSKSHSYNGNIPLRLLIIAGLFFGLFGITNLPARADNFAMLQAPQDVQEVTPSLFGVDMYQINSYFGVVEMAAAGAYWVRPRGVYWSEVQPDEGQDPDWSALDGFQIELDTAQSYGMQVIVLIRSTPDWAQAIPGVACGPIAPDKLSAFGDFLYQLVDRYKDQVSYWELWNEPDVDPDLVPPDSQFGCWGDEDDDYYGGEYYAEMLKVAYPKIKEADPDAQVLVGGLLLDCDPENVCTNERSGKFLDGILLNDGADYFDGISFHAFDYYLGSLGQYSNTNWASSWDTTGPVGVVKADHLRSVLDSAGLTEKYLLNTEASVFCDDRFFSCDDVYETTKAHYVAQSYGGAFTQPLLGNLWFSSRANFRNTDLLGDGLVPKPAYHAYLFAQSLLARAEYVGIVKQFAGVKGYEFRLSDCPNPGETCRLWQIWSLDGGYHLVELPDLPYAVYDVDGDELEATLQQTITLEPVYIQLPASFRVRLPAVPQDYSALQNGDFEFGVSSSGQPVGWVASSGGQRGLSYSLVSSNPTIPEPDVTIPSGNYSMLLGDPSYPCITAGVPLGYAAVEQTIYIPDVPDGTPLSLDFSYVIYTQDGSSSAVYDRFELYLDDGSGPHLVYADGRTDSNVSCDFWYRLPESGWKEASIDLTQAGVSQSQLVDFRGKMVTISFQNWNRYDGYFNTLTYLDDVKLVVGQ